LYSSGNGASPGGSANGLELLKRCVSKVARDLWSLEAGERLFSPERLFVFDTWLVHRRGFEIPCIAAGNNFTWMQS